MSAAGHKRSMPPRIGTHSGTFHCDEALGCFLLRQTPAFSDAEIVRTRDPKVLQDLDIVIDVGGTYEPGEAARRQHCDLQRKGAACLLPGCSPLRAARPVSGRKFNL